MPYATVARNARRLFQTILPDEVEAKRALAPDSAESIQSREKPALVHIQLDEEANEKGQDRDAALEFKVSVCICTRDRPSEARQAVQSALSSVRPVHEVIVSDDSTNADTRAAFSDAQPGVRFVEGPRRGLCANRNNAVDYVTGTHVLFIDDDVVMGRAFVREMQEAFRAQPADLRGTTVLCGLERTHGELVFPHDQTFFGHQTRPYALGEKLNTVVINAAVFPVSLFSKIRFDENLIYGSDEVDFATRAVEAGYVHTLCLQAVNDHYPAMKHRAYYHSFVDASKLYVTFKRYYVTERKPLKGILFAVLAPPRLLLSALKSRRPEAVFGACRSMYLAWKYLMRMRQASRRR